MVVEFSEKVFMLSDLSNYRPALKGLVESTTALGGTALYDAIHSHPPAPVQVPRHPQGPCPPDRRRRHGQHHGIQEGARGGESRRAHGLHDRPRRGVRHRQPLEAQGARRRDRGTLLLARQGERAEEGLPKDRRRTAQPDLAPTPRDEVVDGRWVHLKVETKPKGLSVRHRQGYHAVPREEPRPRGLERARGPRPYQAGDFPTDRASGGPRSARSGGWRCPCAAGPAQPAPGSRSRIGLRLQRLELRLELSLQVGECAPPASTLSRARPISCDSFIARPTPRAAVVARPDCAGAHRAPTELLLERSLLQIQIAACIFWAFACSASRATTCSALRRRSVSEAAFGAYLARIMSLSASRCSRPSCCRRIRKACWLLSGAGELAARGALTGTPPSACAPANLQKLSSPAVVGRSLRRLARKGGASRPSSGSRTRSPSLNSASRQTSQFTGTGARVSRGEPDRLLRRVHRRLLVDEPHLGGTPSGRRRARPRGTPLRDPGEELRDRRWQKGPRDGFDGGDIDQSSPSLASSSEPARASERVALCARSCLPGGFPRSLPRSGAAPLLRLQWRRPCSPPRLRRRRRRRLPALRPCRRRPPCLLSPLRRLLPAPSAS